MEIPITMQTMNDEQLQCLMILVLAMSPIALIWWAWLRLLRP
jgi:hypothetical protein